MFFSTKYALKSIFRRKQKNMLTIFSVTLAVVLLVGVGAATNGIYGAFSNAWWELNADTDLSYEEPASIYFPANLTDRIDASDDVRLDQINGFTTSIETGGNVIYSEGKIDPQTSIYAIEDDSRFGDYYDLNGTKIDIATVLNEDVENPQVIINEELSISLDLQIGDTFQTTVDNGLGEPVPLQATVMDIYDAQLGKGREYVFRASSRVVINLSQLQQRMVPQMQDYVNMVRINLKTLDQGGVLSRDINDLDIDERTYPGKEAVEDVIKALDELYSDRPNSLLHSERNNAAESIKDNIAGIIGVLNLFVFMLNLTALLLIINVQAMNLDDRAYQTAVLRAMGSSRGTIFRIFLVESAMVGILGSIGGILLGLPYGDWMQGIINSIFDMPGADNAKASLSSGVIMGAFALGVLLSILTAALPAWHASGNSITEELRGIKSNGVKAGKKRVLSLLLGISLIVFGFLSAQLVGEFWDVEIWKNIENHLPILLSFGLSLSGIGLIITQIHRRVGLNISAIAFLGLAYFDMFWGLAQVEEGNGDNLFIIMLVYMILGSAMLVIVNFESIMKWINKFFFIFVPLRGVSQVTTRQLMKKKGRATLLFTIFTIILIINVFVSTISTTMTTSLIDQYEWRAQGNEIVVNSAVPSANITQEIQSIDGVTQVYSFRAAWMPIFYENPNPDNADFDMNADLRFRQVIELREEIINPDGDWGDNSYVITVEQVDENIYEKKVGISEEELMDLSKDIMVDFFDGKSYELKSNYTSVETGEEKVETFTEYTALGDFFAAPGSDVFMQGVDTEGNPETIAIKRVSMSNDFLGPVTAFGYSLMVTPEIAERLPVFDYVQAPNLFLVKTVNGFFDDDLNQALALDIQTTLNDLDDPSSLSSRMGVLVGATTRLIHGEMAALWENEAAFWDFLATFASIGLVIGAAGMTIIAMRSVSERMREIGMMRAIGFSRSKVVYSIIIEMFFLGLFGLITGIINGLLMSYMFARSLFEVKMEVPYDVLGIYTAIILGVALFSAILPGVRASRIPPSQALRYTG